MKPCLFLLCAACALADTYPRQPGIDVLNYTFRLEFFDDSDEIAGEASVDVRFLRDGLNEFTLDLISASGGKGMTVSAVNQDADAVTFSHQSDRLTLKLPSPSRAGESREFRIRYHGVPATGLRIGLNKYNERTFFSQNWPDLARNWLPMVDHPYDKATSEFLITAPAKYQVVANGLLVEEIDLGDGRRMTHWKQSVPIPSWLNAVGVAQFASRNFASTKGVPLQTWVYHQDRDNGIVTFEDAAVKSIEFYSDHIGPYSYEKLANVEAAGVRGGMEHASAIFYGEGAVTDRPAPNLVAHEVAHQWFGDSVTERDWDDVWLSEGFATYFAMLFTEHYNGRDAFVAALKRSRDTIFGLEARLPDTPVIHNNLSDMKKVLNQFVYQKGGWTLHMLRGVLGNEKFWTGIRAYYQRYRNGSASTDDFRKVMEAAAGQDLNWFFQQWLHRAGTPAITGGWSYNADAKRVEVELNQTQPGDPFRLPFEIGVQTGGTAEVRIAKVEMTARQQSFAIPADKEPSAVTLDPNLWVLARVEFGRK